MVDYEHSDLFYDRSVHKSLRIYNDDESIVFTNSDIYNESFELTESICSEPTLVFGSCEPSMLKFKIANVVTPLTGKWFNVTETLGSNTDKPFVFGRYKVFSDVPTADKKYRDLTLYDILHDILEIDVAYWYNFILPNSDSSVTLLEFRNSLFEYLGVEQEEVTLPNDGMIIRRTIQTNQLFVFDVLRAVCEINGCFGHIGRNNKFKYIFLKEMTEGLYPSNTLFPADDLYPTDPKNSEKLTNATYIGCQYEDFLVSKIDKVKIKKEDGDVGISFGTGSNAYVVQSNFLTYGMSGIEISSVAKNLLNTISVVWYRPSQIEAKGNPCFEVGDGVRVRTKTKNVFTYVLQRTLKGIQALRDTYEANGDEVQREVPNNAQSEIMQLRGKTNVLTRTIEETRLEISDLENEMSSRITANAEAIDLRVQKGNVISEINLTAEAATIIAERIDLDGLVEAEQFATKWAEIDNLISQRATIKQLNVVTADIATIRTDFLETKDLEAEVAKFGYVTTKELSAEVANLGYVTTDYLEANYFSAAEIETDYLTAEQMASWKGVYTSLRTNLLYVGSTGNLYHFLPMTVTINGQSMVILANDGVTEQVASISEEGAVE